VNEEEGLVTVIVPLGQPRKITLLTLKFIYTDTCQKEIIVVGNKKYKEMYEEISNYCRQIGALFTIDGNERSEQKNYGARMAHGKYLLFIDDDMFIQPGLISECVQLIITRKVDGIVIPQKILPIGLLNRIKYTGLTIKKGYEPMEAPRFIKKDIFLRLEGYDSYLVYGEDADFALRFNKKGYRYVRSTRKIFYLSENNLTQYLRRYFYYGIHAKKYIRKWINDPEGRRYLWKHLFALDKNYFSNIFRGHFDVRTFPINFIILKLLENLMFLVGLCYWRERTDEKDYCF